MVGGAEGVTAVLDQPEVVLAAQAGDEELANPTVRRERLIENTLKKNGMTVNDIDLLIPHQANQRITDAVQERIGIAREKVYSNIEFFGNTSAATIPICLHEALEKGMIKEGNRILTVAFGAGFTWGAALIDW